MEKIVIGCDEAAFGMKQLIIAELKAMGYEVEDVGCTSEEDRTVYPLIAERLAKSIIESDYSKRGILICGTGLGMSITANKFPGIRATVCHDHYSAQRSVLSNNANVLCMGARVIGPELAKSIVKEWLPLHFVDGSSTPKVQEMIRIERDTMK